MLIFTISSLIIVRPSFVRRFQKLSFERRRYVIWQQSMLQLLPMKEVWTHSMTPCHLAPKDVMSIMLKEQMIFALEINKAIGAVTTAGKVLSVANSIREAIPVVQGLIRAAPGFVARVAPLVL